MTADAREHETALTPPPEAYRVHETDLLDALLATAESREAEEQVIEIKRGGRVSLAFRIRPLAEREYSEARKLATSYERSKQFANMKVQDDFDSARYRALLVVAATVEEDRARLWESKAAQEKLLPKSYDLRRQLRAAGVVEATLRAGELDRVVAAIDSLSGYGEDELEEQAKNS